MDEPIDSILVPTDGSETAEAGARRGIDLASATDADLHVLSVVDTRELEPSLSGSTGERSDREQLVAAAADRAVDDVAGLALSHVTGEVTTAVESGVPFKEITDYVDAHDVDLVVMGTHGRTGLSRLLGSVASKTIRTASVPVLTVPPDADEIELGEGSYEVVLLPTDGSDAAAVAVDWGVELATRYDGTVHTLYSVDTSRFGWVDDLGEIYDALEDTGRDALDAIHERAGDAEVSVVGTIGRGPPADVIIDYVDEHDVDLVAMGTHGRAGVERYLIGSVTEAVVRNADVPVCCVPMEGS